VPIVSNASPLILFARIGRLDPLRSVYGEILVPPSVYLEVVEWGTGRPGAADVAAADWVRICRLEGSRQVDLPAALDVGESEAIALAEQLRLSVLLDDGAARREALARGLAITGSAGTLVQAKALGLIGEVRPVLDALVRAGLRLGRAPYERILADAGEMG
jgi:predicted nucleic acid-binding protein